MSALGILKTISQADTDRLAMRRQLGTRGRPLIDRNGDPWYSHPLLFGGIRAVIWTTSINDRVSLSGLTELDDIVNAHGPLGFVDGDGDARRWVFVRLGDGSTDPRLLDELDALQIGRES